MIFYYLLVSVMPLINHPLWSNFIGDLTLVKYVGVAALLYAIVSLPARRIQIPYLRTWQARSFLLLTALATVSFITKGADIPFAIHPYFSYLSFLMFFVVTLTVVDSQARLRMTFLVAIGSVAFASLHVIREWQKYGGMAAGYRPGWVTGDPNYFSISAVLCIPIAFYLLRTAQPTWERRFCQFSLAVMIFALTLAASRGGFLGFVTAAVYAIARAERSVRLRWSLILLLVLLPLSVVAPSSPLERFIAPNWYDEESAEVRKLLWTAGVNMMSAHPLDGVGLGSWKISLPAYSPATHELTHIAHNAYVQIGAEIGLPALVAFVLMIGATLLALERVRRAWKDKRDSFGFNVAAAMQTGLIGYCVAAFFVSGEYQKLFWLMIFLSVCLAAIVERPCDPPPPHAIGRRASVIA